MLPPWHTACAPRRTPCMRWITTPRQFSFTRRRPLYSRSRRRQLELARTLSSSIQPLFFLVAMTRLLPAGERARKIFQEQGNTRRLARLEINIGNIYHRQDRFTEAAEVYQRAYQVLLQHGDTEGLAAVLSNLSLCYISLNDFPRSLELHAWRASIARKKACLSWSPMPITTLPISISCGANSAAPSRCCGTRLISAKKADDAYQLALCNLDLSEIYLELNLSSEAANLGERRTRLPGTGLWLRRREGSGFYGDRRQAGPGRRSRH